MSTLKEQVAKLRAGMRSKTEESKPEAPHEMETGGKSAFFLTSVGAVVVLCAAITEWYWAILFCIEAVGKVHFNWDTAAASVGAGKNVWDFSFATNLPILIGLIFATVPIVLWSMVWLPTWFAARGTGRWRRITAAFTGLLCNFLIVVSGTVIMNGNRQDQVRADLVVEQTRDAGIDQLRAQKATLEARLTGMTTEKMGSRFQAQAARAGVVGWDETIRQAKASGDPLLPQILRARGSAVAADKLQADIDALDAKIAAAPTEAAVAASVNDEAGKEMNAFAEAVEVYRPPFVALTCTLIGIFGGWWLVGLYDKLAEGRKIIREQTGTPWADEARMIPDLSEEETPKARGMQPTKERVTDADTGEELVKITPKEYWRRAKGKKKGEAVPVDVGPPDPAPQDEPGVVLDSDSRAARTQEQPAPEVVVKEPPVEAAPEPEDEVAAALRQVFGEQPPRETGLGPDGRDGVMQAAE